MKEPRFNIDNIITYKPYMWIVVWTGLNGFRKKQWFVRINTLSNTRSSAIKKFLDTQHERKVYMGGSKRVTWDTAVKKGHVACVKFDVVAGLLYGQAR